MKSSLGYSPIAPNAGTPFPYPGSKTRLSRWVISNMSDHERFVSVFGGSGGILFDKSPSQQELWNDGDTDLYTFFDVLKTQPQELINRISNTPYHERLYSDWKTAWENGDRPADAVEHALRFYYLARASYGSDLGGFRCTVDGRKNSARQFNNANSRLEAFSQRLQTVSLTNEDWESCFSLRREGVTLYYCDPPYTGTEERYPESYDRQQFIERLNELRDVPGVEWMVSETTPLENLDYKTALQQGECHQINNVGGTADVTEYLLLSYEPDGTDPFVGRGQQTLTSHQKFESGREAQ